MDADETLEFLRTLQEIVDWFHPWWLFWITVACTAIGGVFGWFKNRIGFGLLMGALFGPIGWLVVVLIDGDFRPCPGCSKPNRSQAKRCKYCASELAPPPPPTSSAQANR